MSYSIADKIEKIVLHAAWQAIKFSQLSPEVYCDWLDDIFQEAETEYVATQSYIMASNAAARFIYNQVQRQGMTGGHGNSYKDEIVSIRNFIPSQSADDFIVFREKPFPILSLCHLLKRLLRKGGGKRGRNSVAVKSLIIRDRIIEGLSFNFIASRYNITTDNAKRHYRMGFTLIISWFYKNAHMMSDEQLGLLSAIRRRPVRNFNSQGQLYNYTDRGSKND